MNRGLAMMQNQLHSSPLALADENSEPKQKKKCRKRTVSKHSVPPKIVARSSELPKKRRELWMQRIRLLMLRLAVEASRPNLPMPAVDQR